MMHRNLTRTVVWSGSLLAGLVAVYPVQAAFYPEKKPLEKSIDLSVDRPFTLAQQPSNSSDSLPTNPENPFLQPVPLPTPLPSDETAPIAPSPSEPIPEPTPEPSPSAPDSTIPIAVRQIQVVGSTVFSAAALARLTQPYEGRSLTLADLQQVTDAITQLYLDSGYLTSRALLVDQQITQGIVQIRVIEGSLEQIEVEGTRQVDPGYVRRQVAPGGKTPVNQGRLEDQLRLLRLDPLFENVEASLRPGTGLGQSILVVRVSETDPLLAAVSADNYSTPSVGSERVGIVLGYRNVTGWGDELVGSYVRSTTGGSNVFDFHYRVPLNALNGTLQLRAAPSFYRITAEEFADLEIEGRSQLYEISYRQPLWRSPREEFALSLGFTYEEGETLVSSFLSSATTTSVIRFGQDFVRRDPQGAWAMRSQFNFGTDWFNATEANGATPDGQFVSWLGQVQRVQILNPAQVLIAQLDLQLAADPLLSSQQFVIGGGQSIRGYRQNARLGDNGFRASIEDRIAIQRQEDGSPTLQLAPFADFGMIWNTGRHADALPDQRFLAGLGLGILWQPLSNLSLRADVALPLIDLHDRGDDIQDYGIYFSIQWQR